MSALQETYAQGYEITLSAGNVKDAEMFRRLLVATGPDGASIVKAIQTRSAKAIEAAQQEAREVIASTPMSTLSEAAKATLVEMEDAEKRDLLSAKDKGLSIVEYKALFGEVATPDQVACAAGWDLLKQYQAAKQTLGENFVLSVATRRTLADLA